MAKQAFWDIDGEGNATEAFMDVPDEQPSYSANDGNDGESEAGDFMDRLFSAAQQTTSAGTSSFVASLFGGQSTDGFKGLGASAYATPAAAQDSQGSSVIDRLLDQAKTGVTKAWEKDPWAFLERGAGAVAGMVKDQRDQDARERHYRAQLDQQNNAARIKQEDDDRYSKSVAGSKRVKSGKQGPLKRVSGSQIFDAQGKVVG